MALADKVSDTWIAFARTGDPNTSKLPHWPAFNATERPTMVINNQSKVVSDPIREQRLAMFRATVSWPELLRGSRRSLLASSLKNRRENGQLSVDPGRHVESQNVRDQRIDVDVLKLFDGEPGFQIGTGGEKNPAHIGHLRNVVAMHPLRLSLSGL